MQIPNQRVKSVRCIFTFQRDSKLSAARATLEVAPDQVGWYKVCAAIRVTTSPGDRGVARQYQR
jgi:hypothetical protein